MLTLNCQLVGVVHAHAVHQLAAEDTDEGLLAHVRVVDELEGQCGERLVLRWIAAIGLLFVVGVVGDDRTQVVGRRQVVDDSVQKKLDALVLISGTAKHRNHHQLDGSLSDAGNVFTAVC